MTLDNKLYDASEEELGLEYRKDIQANCFRDVHQRFYPKVYDYSLCQTQNQEEAIELTNSYFVSIARTMTDMEQPEQVVRGMSSKVMEARAAKGNN